MNANETEQQIADKKWKSEIEKKIFCKDKNICLGWLRVLFSTLYEFQVKDPTDFRNVMNDSMVKPSLETFVQLFETICADYSLSDDAGIPDDQSITPRSSDRSLSSQFSTAPIDFPTLECVDEEYLDLHGTNLVSKGAACYLPDRVALKACHTAAR